MGNVSNERNTNNSLHELIRDLEGTNANEVNDYGVMSSPYVDQFMKVHYKPSAASLALKGAISSPGDKHTPILQPVFNRDAYAPLPPPAAALQVNLGQVSYSSNKQ